MKANKTIVDQKCRHCGDLCIDDVIQDNHGVFCCSGCQMVHELLQENNMGDYYRFEDRPGISQRKLYSKSFDYLDNQKIQKALLSFREGGISKATFFLPQIHCSACLWLLEHLSNFDRGIIKSSVNFHTKKVTITFKNDMLSLREVVELLVKIGYEPEINYDHLSDKLDEKKVDHSLIYKLGMAGFAFGNIMLLSFPEYLGFDKASYLFHIGYINIILAVPVLLYSGFDYIRAAYKGLKIGSFNIDLPIALGMIALFCKSVYDIITQSGEGYLDSFAGFVFFLLIGRWFQSYTYRSLDFDRNYKSYFPISAYIRKGNHWITTSLDLIKPKDILLIRNHELVPADGILRRGKARLDYSFVTGESNLVSKEIGSVIYAGAKHQGESVEIEVTKSVDQSYLTQLWNEDAFHQKRGSQASNLIASISKYFTLAVLLLAVVTLCYWLQYDSGMAINTFVAVLIVACPCALALSIPFTYGNILRLMSRDGLYMRNIHTIEQIQDVDYIVFDKTGTLTDSRKMELIYVGNDTSAIEQQMIGSVCCQSNHPLSRAITRSIMVPTLEISNFKEHIGKGLSAECQGMQIKLGSAAYIFGTTEDPPQQGVFIEIDGQYIGRYEFLQAFRDDIDRVVDGLQHNYKLSVLSGDTNHEADRVRDLLGATCEVFFDQSPQDKLSKIKTLQDAGHKVMMVGDGLNDAGALKQADVGVVISDEENNFSPACDAILEAEQFKSLFSKLSYLRKAKYIIFGAFALALMYNSVGLYFAVTGQLSPVIAAILMPLSSITVIIYGVTTSWFLLSKSK